MQSLSNPFQSKSPFPIDSSHLLNYGEDNITLYQTLTRKPSYCSSRNNIIVQTNLLRKFRRQVYEAQQQKDQEYKEEGFLEDGYVRQKPQDKFWSKIRKTNSYRTYRNPFEGNYSSTGLTNQPPLNRNASMAALNSNRGTIMQMNLDKKKQMIRHQVGMLKAQLTKCKIYSSQASQGSESVSKLYKQRRKNNQYANSNELTFGGGFNVSKKSKDEIQSVKFSRNPQTPSLNYE